MDGMGIPHCCGFALVMDCAVPGYEFRCPDCGQRYEVFGDFDKMSPENMTDDQARVAKDRGWDVGPQTAAPA